MIDIKDLRKNPQKYIDGAAAKGITVDIARLLELDAKKRAIQTEMEAIRCEQRRCEKQIGEIMKAIKTFDTEKKKHERKTRMV